MNLISRWKVAAAAAIRRGGRARLVRLHRVARQVRIDARPAARRHFHLHLRRADLPAGAEPAGRDVAAGRGGGDDFVETPCYDDEDFEERPCTEEEIAEQRAGLGAAGRSAQGSRPSARPSRCASSSAGSTPPTPQAAEELAARLRRQEGWKRVEYRGDGLFEVEFSLTSRLGPRFRVPDARALPDVEQLRARQRAAGRQRADRGAGLRARRAAAIRSRA